MRQGGLKQRPAHAGDASVLVVVDADTSARSSSSTSASRPSRANASRRAMASANPMWLCGADVWTRRIFGSEEGSANSPSPVSINDLHLLAHLQHKQRCAVAERPRVQHQLHGLRNQHEEPAHLWVCHGHGPAVRDLGQKRRNDAAVAGLHVAEPHGGKARGGRPAEAFDDHLRHTLGRAHHAGRVHGLVRGDQYKPLHAPLLRGLGDDACAEDVVLHRLARVVFHERHVFVGSRVKHHLRSRSIEHLFDSQSIGDISDHWMQFHFRNSRGELERDLPALGLRLPAPALRRFWMMLAHYHAQVWNASELARAFAVAHTTVQRYLDVLTATFMVRQLQSWHENLGKRQVKAPKIYLRDSGLLHALLGLPDARAIETHPVVGASWEGFALEAVIARLGARPASNRRRVQADDGARRDEVRAHCVREPAL